MNNEVTYWKENYAAVVAERDKLAAELEQYRQAIESGLYVKLPPYEETNYNGLKVKYHVIKARNGEAVENCFVLRPDKDPAARCALMAYAINTSNQKLARDLFHWLNRLESDAEQALKGLER